MAISAELSMKQAAALSLQQQIKEKELQVRGGDTCSHNKGIQKSTLGSWMCNSTVSHWFSHYFYFYSLIMIEGSTGSSYLVSKQLKIS